MRERNLVKLSPAKFTISSGQMKKKHYDIKIISDDGTPEQEVAQGEFYFDDLPPFVQETIFDLIASIVETKRHPQKETSYD